MPSSLNPTVLVVEDEPAQMELLAFNLGKEGYNVLRAETGEDALLLVEEGHPDLVLLDWMLPNISGLEVCRQIKRRKKTAGIPIIMLTARGEEDDKVRGLDLGAEDYMVKPYSVNELMARVRAALRRARPAGGGGILSCGGIEVDLGKHEVRAQGQPIDLGPVEYRLLVNLIEYPGRVWSRQQLLDRVWGTDVFIETRTVDVHVGRLRKKLAAGGLCDPIRTVRGFGYAMNDSAKPLSVSADK